LRTSQSSQEGPALDASEACQWRLILLSMGPMGRNTLYEVINSQSIQLRLGV
jgi:hypothetical protein